MRKKSKIMYIVSGHLAAFCVAAASYGNGSGLTFVFGLLSTLALAITTFYELAIVSVYESQDSTQEGN